MSEAAGSTGAGASASAPSSGSARRATILGAASPVVTTGTPTGDRALVRRVRRRLVLWSGGITLVILAVLGSAVYLGVAGSLRASSETLLRERATDLGLAVRLAPELPSPSRPGRIPLGIVFGGRASGTLAVIITPDERVVGGPPGGSVEPDPDGVVAARASGQDVIRELRYGDTPVRVLSRPITVAAGTYVVQILADRGAEERTLGQLAVVLLVGGLGGLVLAIAGGWIYASRALHPIRESMRRQREFAADASHELRTPLAVARAGVDFIARHPTARVAEMDDTISDVRAGLDHMTDLVETLLLLARSDSGAVELERSEVDLADLAATALAGLGPLAATRSVQLHLDAEPVEMRGDPLRLRQLVAILVDNAIRHGRAGGNAWVRVARGERAGGPAGSAGSGGSAPSAGSGGSAPPAGSGGSAPSAGSGGSAPSAGSGGSAPSAGSAATARPAASAPIILEVDDDGPGIPAGDRARIFDRFWRGQAAPAGGAGLGLSIAAWIAERHGGSISAGERPGGGARFVVRLAG